MTQSTSTDMTCTYCHDKLGIRRDSRGLLICRRCILAGKERKVMASKSSEHLRAGRNDLCQCGSGQKRKRCHP